MMKPEKLMRRFRAVLRGAGNREGNTAVEFALFLPVIMLSLLAAVELGRYGVEMNRLTNAARAGMQYALQGQGYAVLTDNVAAAVRTDAGDATNSLTVNVRTFCRCSNGTELDCTDECSLADDTKYAPMYTTIAVSETFEALFPLLAANPAFQMPGFYSPSVVTTTRIR